MSHRWTQTWSGLAFSLPPKPGMFNIYDIAHANARKCRYSGMVNVENYSVAEHSVVLSHWGEMNYDNLAVPRGFLMHDAVEAYIQDIPSPLKAVLPDYVKLETKVEKVVYNWVCEWTDCEVTPFWDPIIKSADKRICIDEKEQLMGPAPMEWEQPEGGRLGVTLVGYRPIVAERMFLARFNDLFHTNLSINHESWFDLLKRLTKLATVATQTAAA